MYENKSCIYQDCDDFVDPIENSEVSVVYCEEAVEFLIPKTVESGNEKHLPVVSINGNEVCVSIGMVAHPMTEEHSIQWVYLQTAKDGQVKHLNPGDAPEIRFVLSEGDKLLAVYAYCNLHGLWKTGV
jgi:superoxide reductase